MTITPEGLSGRGYYKFGFLDILLEIDSGLRIVKGKELWLKDPKVKVNTLDVPVNGRGEGVGNFFPSP